MFWVGWVQAWSDKQKHRRNILMVVLFSRRMDFCCCFYFVQTIKTYLLIIA